MPDSSIDPDRQTPGGGWVPVPDPTKLTTEAVAAATTQYRRELANLRLVVETRLGGMDEDRRHLWDLANSWPGSLETQLERRRREFQEDLQALRELLEARLTAMDLATGRAAEVSQGVRQDVELQISHLHQMHTADVETLRAAIAAAIAVTAGETRRVQDIMAEKFIAVDGRFEESKVAVDAAFAAAKEAVAEQNKTNSQAIAKSETATKEQLASLSRVTDAGLAGLADKIDDARTRITSLESHTAGQRSQFGDSRLNTATLVQVLAFLVVTAGVLYAILHH